MAREEWQLAEIEAGLAEAIGCDFASEAEVEHVFNKYSLTCDSFLHGGLRADQTKC